MYLVLYSHRKIIIHIAVEVANLNYNTLLLEYNNIAHVLFNLFWKSHLYSGFQLVKLIAAFSLTNLRHLPFLPYKYFYRWRLPSTVFTYQFSWIFVKLSVLVVLPQTNLRKTNFGKTVPAWFFSCIVSNDKPLCNMFFLPVSQIWYWGI